jgi:hypothetical protein
MPFRATVDKGQAAPYRPAPTTKTLRLCAQMAELVDAPASGAGARKGVEVRVLFWAPKFLDVAEKRSLLMDRVSYETHPFVEHDSN